MKKRIISIIAIAAALIILSTTSCAKKCKCVTNIAGIESTTEIELDNNMNKCSDLNSSTTVAGITTSIKCN